MYSFTEENYLKAIFKLQEKSGEAIHTNAIAKMLETKAASVTDMVKKLSDKKLLKYKKYHGVELTPTGKRIALETVRKHRLWETFLHDKLNFSWDEVHHIAEQLEHIQADKLTDRLDEFLGFPEYDPHGDPIPNKHGEMITGRLHLLLTLKENLPCTFNGVADHSPDFLQHLKNINLNLGSTIIINKKNAFDHSMAITVNNKRKMVITYKVANNILVKSNHH